jgi:hypothetical protein
MAVTNKFICSYFIRYYIIQKYTHTRRSIYIFESLKKLVIQRIRQIWMTCPVLFMMGCKTKGHAWTRFLSLTEIPAITLHRFYSLARCFSLARALISSYTRVPLIPTAVTLLYYELYGGPRASYYGIKTFGSST